MSMSPQRDKYEDVCVCVCFETLKNSLRSFCFSSHSPPPCLSCYVLGQRCFIPCHSAHTSPLTNTHCAAHQTKTDSNPIKTTRCLGKLKIWIQISNEIFRMPGSTVHHTAKKPVYSTFAWTKIKSLQWLCVSFHEERWVEGWQGAKIIHLGDLDEFSGQVSEQIIHTNVHTPYFLLPTNTFQPETAELSNWALKAPRWGTVWRDEELYRNHQINESGNQGFHPLPSP